jgi:hypothetical protein
MIRLIISQSRSRLETKSSVATRLLKQIDDVCNSCIFYLEVVQRKGFDDVRTGHTGHVIYQGSSAGQFHNTYYILIIEDIVRSELQVTISLTKK